MESGNSLSMISLIMHASLPVQLIMALLVALSVISWSFIVSKLITLRAVGRSTDDFERTFWSGADLNSMYQRVSANQNSMGMEKIFQAGFGEFIKLRRQGGVELSDLMDGTRRAMKAAAQRELDELDRHTAFWPPWARSARISACSARCGASCMPLSAWATPAARLCPPWRPALPKR